MGGTRLRLPTTRIPGTVGGLNEMSHSDTNSRSMPPPQLKHKASGRKDDSCFKAKGQQTECTTVPEPQRQIKRTTLVDRAGDAHRTIPTPQPSRPLSASIKANALAGAKPVSLNSSTRSNGYTARNTSNSSSCSTGSYTRPQSATSNYRPQTSMSHARAQSQDIAIAAGRPTTALGQREENTDPNGGPAKRKGTMPFSISSLQGKGKTIDTQHADHEDSGGFLDIPPKRAATRCESPIRTIVLDRRCVSLSTAFQGLSLQASEGPKEDSAFPSLHNQDKKEPETPSKIPKRSSKMPKVERPPSVFRSPRPKSRVQSRTLAKVLYLTKDSDTPVPAWDTKGRLEDMETLYAQLKSNFQSAAYEKNGLEESLSLYKTRINELEQIRLQLNASNKSMTDELSDVKVKLSTTSLALDESRRSHGIEIDELTRRHRNLVEDKDETHRKELDRLRRDEWDEKDRLRKQSQDEIERLQRQKRDELADQERLLKAELDEERSRRLREVQDLTTQFSIERQSADTDHLRRERDMDDLRKELEETKTKLESSTTQVNSLRDKLAEAATNALTLETTSKALKAKIDFLESDNQAQSQAFADLHQKMQDALDRAADAQDKLRVEETLRRKLHNQVQELKGNIRVFCRVRPALETDVEDKARINFPDSETDSKEVAIQGPEQKSALGNVTTSNHAFAFDRVFAPRSQNAEIFDEISQLVQSALDGYNVCIFCYGQTGSGKTYTMSSIDGMIPRAVTQIYDTAKSLEDKGWKYTMEGSFIEVYNETLNDLLGKAEDWEKKKHEIKHDPLKLRTIVTDVNTVHLDSPSRVNSILEQAGRNRSVAATKANSRSSRSHSVFILKLTGENTVTGERSEGTLNLVDLAGSERLSHSGATGERMKETQHINKSLSCLGDVISALGQGKEGGHVPYRNSKLTYLLQNSLGGNSKTLMFVMISPLQAHLGETLTSLKFATKVHNTHIGTAKRQAKVKD
ncbi:Kinesin motor domain-containing protein 7 [Elsinoe fawcettii]|nr:Kinesin motor domain-containing protein 7 [Elsinoe fawcettii]